MQPSCRDRNYQNKFMSKARLRSKIRSFSHLAAFLSSTPSVMPVMLAVSKEKRPFHDNGEKMVGKEQNVGVQIPILTRLLICQLKFLSSIYPSTALTLCRDSCSVFL